MQLSIVTPPHPPPLPGDSGHLPGDSILYFVMSKVQPRVLPETAGDIFLVNPRIGPLPITPDAFGQSPGIHVYGHPGIVEFQSFDGNISPHKPGVGPGSAGTQYSVNPGKSPLDPRYCPGSGGRGYN